MGAALLYQRLAAAYYTLERRDRSLLRDLGALTQLFPAGGRVVDLGCGSGEHALALAAQGYDAVGLDASLALIQLARARSNDARRFVCGDFRRPQPALTGFDGAYSLYGCFNYLIEAADLAAAFHTTAQMLRPGGRFALEVWRRAPYAALGRRTVSFADRFGDGARTLSMERRRRVLLDDVARAGRVRLIHEYALNLRGKRAFFAEEHPLQLFEADELAAAARPAGLELERAGRDFAGRPATAHSGALRLVFVRARARRAGG